MTDLGRLKKIDLRSVWKKEDTHFTPWLAKAENIALLGETLGLELEVEAVEQSVGPFRADILCKDTSDNSWVLIENQLERTDHSHLGQLITYAAGLDAVTIVCIAAKIADDHRKACDWLNEITDENVSFFALEVELWAIGDSQAAPKFNIVSQPNDWGEKVVAAKKVIASGANTELGQLQIDYWTAFESRLAAANGSVKARKKVSGSWIGHGIGKSWVTLNTAMVTTKGLLRVEIYLGGKVAKGYFSELIEKKAEIESTLGTSLDWQAMEGKTEARICLVRPDNDFQDKSAWPDQHEWLLKWVLRFHKVFLPFIQQLGKDPNVEAL